MEFTQSEPSPAAALSGLEMCPKPRDIGSSSFTLQQTTMMRDSTHASVWRGLACLFTLSQLPLTGAQVAGIEKATNDSLLWGPYRPNLYFGVRPRIPKSLMGGLMWTRVEDYSSVQNSTSSQDCMRTRTSTLQLIADSVLT